MKVVICGGGIMGVSTAYYLALQGVGSTIIEEKAIASGASGNAGGFLARDWCDHFEVGPLARLSFDIHMQLADSLENCDYRRLDTLQVDVSESGGRKNVKDLPKWIDGRIADTGVMGSTENTAQVHPRKLCEALLSAAQAKAEVNVRIARIFGFARDGDRVTGVKIRSSDGAEAAVEADVVALTMGPWSGAALRWLDLAPVISGRRAHGIVLRAPAERAAQVDGTALFVEWSKSRREHLSSEVYPRPDGTIYMCGMSDSKELPDSIHEVEVDKEIAGRIKVVGDQVSSAIADATVERQQSCYMPTSLDSLPVIGKVPGIQNVYIAAGHSCWGILNGPGSGKILADFVKTGHSTVINVAAFNPLRLLE